MQQTQAIDKVFLQAIAMLSLIFLTSCIRHRPPEVQPAPPAQDYLSHRITHSGETLGVISLWYTGDSQLWKDFFIPATSGTIRKLKRGDEILIPIKLVVRREALTKEFISSHRQITMPKGAKGSSGKIVIDKPQAENLSKQTELEETLIKDALPAELTPLEVEPFDEKTNAPVELEKEFIDRIVK